MSFVSKEELAEARDARREQREAVLAKEKRRFEKRQREEAQRAARGETTWINPELEERFSEEKTHHHHQHHKKKDKKEKKDRKEKKSKRAKTDDNPEASSEEDDWVEAGVEAAAASESATKAAAASSLARESWMSVAEPNADETFALFGATDTRVKKKDVREQEKAEKDEERAKERNKRELNPYLKDGGTGLPPEEPPRGSESRGADAATSWREAALRRSRGEGGSSRRRGGGSLQEHVQSRASSSSSTPNKMESPTSASQGMLRPEEAGSGWSNRSTPQSSARVDYDEMDPVERAERQASDDRPRGSGLRHGYSASAPMDMDVETADEPSERHDRRTAVAASLAAGPGNAGASSGGANSELLNSIAADLMRAELMGDEAEVARLKAALEGARASGGPAASSGAESRIGRGGRDHRGGQRNERRGPGADPGVAASAAAAAAASRQRGPREDVLLVREGRGGAAMPVSAGRASGGGGSSGLSARFASAKGTKPVPTHDEKGERLQYYADDNANVSVRDMLERERLGLDEDYDKAYADMMTRTAARTEAGDYDADDMFADRVAKPATKEKQLARDRQRTIAEYQRKQKALEGCSYCLDNPQFKKHLLISLGSKIALMIPERGHLCDGHCILVPTRHIASTRGLDEDEFDELAMFKRCLVDMYEAQGKDVIFLESSSALRRHPHAVVHCVPLSRDDGSTAPMFFKKAILESDTLWAQNKKLIDTKEKGLRRSIPEGFPYFHVEFGRDGGFAHVIEDESLFPHYFGQEVVGGMLDLPPRTWLHPPTDSFDVLKQRNLRLSRHWRDYDWTAQLKEPPA